MAHSPTMKHHSPAVLSEEDVMRRKLADQTAPALLTRLSIDGFEGRRSPLSSCALAKNDFEPPF
jgi:hypothetical protein